MIFELSLKAFVIIFVKLMFIKFKYMIVLLNITRIRIARHSIVVLHTRITYNGVLSAI